MTVDEIKGNSIEEINLEILGILNEEKEINLLEMTKECEKIERKIFLNYIFKILINIEDGNLDRNVDDFYRDRKLKIIYMDKLFIQSNIIILFNIKDDVLFFDNPFWAYTNKTTNKKIIDIEIVQKIIRKMSEIVLNEKIKRQEIEKFLKNGRIGKEERITSEILLNQIKENILL